MKDNQAKYPQLRFKGFTNPWEQRKTKELCDISTGKGNTQDKVKDGKYPFYVRSATIERSNEYLYDQEAVLTVGDGVGTGKVFHYVNGKYNLHQRVYRMFNFNHGVSAKYFYHYFSKNFYRRVMSMTAKTSVDSVRMEMIADMKIKFPSPAEQETIVAVLDGVDDLISLHQRKLAKLKELKQGYLQKLFPKNGSKFPQLRFAGFADAWEQRKLTEIVNRVNKSSNSDVLPKVEFEDIVSGEGRLNKDISSKLDSRKGTLFESENILYGKLRPYLKNWLFPDFEGVALGDFWVFEATDVSVPSFDYYLIQSDDYQKVANDTSGTKMPRSDWKNVSSTDFAIPSKDEQKQIGAFFKQLDDTITLHQRKLEKLQELKKGYLQKMFC